jgi:uncharacterized membrane protein YvlD (DUF360 family)
VSGTGAQAAERVRWRARWGVRQLRLRRLNAPELKRMAVTLTLATVALAVTIALVPGVAAAGAADVLLTTVVLGVVSAVLRPVLTSFALLLGWAGVLLAGFGVQALLFYVALSISPGIEVDGFWPAFWASWLFGALMTVVTWLASAGDSAAYLTHLVQRARRPAGPDPDTGPGVVLIQVDGLAAPLLRWALASGDLPTLSRWMREGSHVLTPWHAQLPPTTPASQAGLLHGRSGEVPAFRWYEKDAGRLVVSNRPKDAALIESRLTDGRGLLADDGVSICNVFSGDAATSLVTMSGFADHPARRRPTRALATFLINPYGLSRSIVLTAAEMLKELHQRRRQRVRDVLPRIDRHGSYVALRGVTNVLLRDLNAGLIADQMMAGASVVYCDFTDYDEVAHHAGPTRPESLASLAGIDHLVGVLERMSAEAPRPYHFVVLSDHGQSQGATFKQRHGLRLEELVRTLMGGGSVAASTGEDEAAGPVGTFLAQIGEQGGAAGRLSRRMLHDLGEATPAVTRSVDESDLVLIASGNLAMAYFTRGSGRLALPEIERLYPGLVAGLVTHPGIGFVVARDGDGRGVVLGRDGVRHLTTGLVEGEDPLAPYGPHAVADVVRHDGLPHVGDLVVVSPLDPGTDEVAAYEELVGCHGGLGGWQSDAVLVHPTAWPLDGGPLIGADAVHHQLVRWLELLGQRRGLRTEPEPSSQPAGPPA